MYLEKYPKRKLQTLQPLLGTVELSYMKRFNLTVSGCIATILLYFHKKRLEMSISDLSNRTGLKSESVIELVRHVEETLGLLKVSAN